MYRSLWSTAQILRLRWTLAWRKFVDGMWKRTGGQTSAIITSLDETARWRRADHLLDLAHTLRVSTTILSELHTWVEREKMEAAKTTGHVLKRSRCFGSFKIYKNAFQGQGSLVTETSKELKKHAHALTFENGMQKNAVQEKRNSRKRRS